MVTGPPLEVKVWGELACFTRPEMKVERVSYPVMTPSAARGVLEAVFWKPEFDWHVREIWVLKEPRFFSILRNEVKSVATLSGARGGYFADEDRAQRHTLALKEVAYVIRADISLRARAQAEDPAKFRDQFRRRVARGAFHHAPYLGCREFAAYFSPPQPADTPIDEDSDLGLMLFDMAYSSDRSAATPRFFRAILERGVLHVPQELYEQEVA